MYSGYISVDFVAIEAQIMKLKEYACFVESIYDRVKVIHNALSNMSLGDVEDDLLCNIHALEKITDDIRSRAAKLKRITELYAECENSITQAVYNLSYNMPQNKSSKSKFGITNDHLLYIASLKLGGFTGHSIVNDDWLNELVHETEVSK